MINFSFSEHGDLGELLVDPGDVLVHPGRHARELAGLGPDHLDELGDLAVRDLAELGQRPHAAEHLLLGRLPVEELQYRHRQLRADVVEDLGGRGREVW